MKKMLAVALIAVWAAVQFTGCATPVEPMRITADAPWFDEWAKSTAMEEIRSQLVTNSYVKDLGPMVIVPAKGERVSKNIDSLTADFRTRLEPYLLENPSIDLVLRHPVDVIERPYALEDLPCNPPEEPRLAIAIDILKAGPAQGNLARVAVRALDLANNSWINGFSVASPLVRLTEDQVRALGEFYPDDQLRGLKLHPYAITDRDEIGAFMAQALSCIYRGHSRQSPDGDIVRVYVDDSVDVPKRLVEMNAKAPDIVWFMSRQINYCNQIQLVPTPEGADWSVSAGIRETGSAKDLCQMWVETRSLKDASMVKGLSSFVYIQPGPAEATVQGKWEIRNASSSKPLGHLFITEDSHGKIWADLVGGDGAFLRKRDIMIHRDGNDLDASFYDRTLRKTIIIQGKILDRGRTIMALASFYPSSGNPLRWTLVRAK